MTHLENQQLQSSIRKASIADVETISSLTDTAYAKYIFRLGRKPQPMTANYHRMVTEHHAWLLYLGDQPIGVLILIYESNQVLIYSIATSPEYQNQGWGRYLVGWGEEEAQRQGYTRIRLHTNARMDENVARYKRLGYQETHREEYLGSTVIHMAKDLAHNMRES